MTRIPLQQRIETFVRSWPQWSPAEQRRLDFVLEEVLRYGRTGIGNRFIRQLWTTHVLPALGFNDCGEGPFVSFADAVHFAESEVGIEWLIGESTNGFFHVYTEEYPQ